MSSFKTYLEYRVVTIKLFLGLDENGFRQCGSQTSSSGMTSEFVRNEKCTSMGLP